MILSGDVGKRLYQGDIMLDETPDEVFHEMGRKSQEGSFGVIIWPLRVWRTRDVPYTINGHTQDSISNLLSHLCHLPYYPQYILSISKLYFKYIYNMFKTSARCLSYYCSVRSEICFFFQILWHYFHFDNKRELHL